MAYVVLAVCAGLVIGTVATSFGLHAKHTIKLCLALSAATVIAICTNT